MLIGVWIYKHDEVVLGKKCCAKSFSKFWEIDAYSRYIIAFALTYHISPALVNYTHSLLLCCREHRVTVKDRRFEPMILLIEQHDKVWFGWENTKDAHCIYQIQPPRADHPASHEYFAVCILLSVV